MSENEQLIDDGAGAVEEDEPGRRVSLNKSPQPRHRPWPLSPPTVFPALNGIWSTTSLRMRLLLLTAFALSHRCPAAHARDPQVSTCKYSVFSFFPKNLWEQFQRIANIYFLVISLLQVSWPDPRTVCPHPPSPPDLCTRCLPVWKVQYLRDTHVRTHGAQLSPPLSP
jgi:hypothetical protein